MIESDLFSPHSKMLCWLKNQSKNVKEFDGFARTFYILSHKLLTAMGNVLSYLGVSDSGVHLISSNKLQ